MKLKGYMLSLGSLLEIMHQLRNQACSQIPDTAQNDHASAILDFLKGMYGRIQVTQRMRNRFQKQLSIACQADISSCFFKQRYSKLCFQLGNGMT